MSRPVGVMRSRRSGGGGSSNRPAYMVGSSPSSVGRSGPVMKFFAFGNRYAEFDNRGTSYNTAQDAMRKTV